MAQYTQNLNLYEKNPSTDGDDTFNITTMMNDNWDKIDSAVGDLNDLTTSSKDDLVAAINEVDSNFDVKADIDGNNIIESFATKLVGAWGNKFSTLSMPDYANGIDRSANTNYTATTNGWLYVVQSGAYPDGEPKGTTVTINGKGLYCFTIGHLSGSITIYTARMFPIAKGSTYKINVNQGNASGKFYPCIGG